MLRAEYGRHREREGEMLEIDRRNRPAEAAQTGLHSVKELFQKRPLFRPVDPEQVDRILAAYTKCRMDPAFELVKLR